MKIVGTQQQIFCRGASKQINLTMQIPHSVIVIIKFFIFLINKWLNQPQPYFVIKILFRKYLPLSSTLHGTAGGEFIGTAAGLSEWQHNHTNSSLI